MLISVSLAVHKICLSWRHFNIHLKKNKQWEAWNERIAVPELQRFVPAIIGIENYDTKINSSSAEIFAWVKCSHLLVKRTDITSLQNDKAMQKSKY